MNLASLLTTHARQNPDAPAIVDGTLTLSARELDGFVWGLAAHFHAQGLHAGLVVGLRLQDPLMHLAALLALARIGVVSLPLAGGADAAALMRRVGASRSVTDATQEEESSALRLVRSQLLPALLESPAQEHLMGEPPEDRLLYKTSSGTTGAPKIVAETHLGLALSIRREIDSVGYRPRERFMTPVSVHLDGPRRRYLACILAGGVAVMPPRVASGRALVDAIRAEGIGHFACVASHAQTMVNAAKLTSGPSLALRIFRLSAGPSSPALHAAVRAVLTPNLMMSYGCSEIGPITAADPQCLAADPNTVGWPLSGIEVDVVDPEGRVLGEGLPGRIRIRAAGMPSAYHEVPQHGGARFEDGWFYPGDVGMFTASGLRHLGRADDLMIVDGMNIYPAEIEEAMSAHPAVADCVAFASAHAVVHHLPMCAVALHPEAHASERALLAHARARLGRRGPWRVVILPTIPRNEHGKPVRAVLREQVEASLQSAPDPHRTDVV